MADLTPKQQQAASLIASGKTQRQAAEAVGVSPQTLTAWAKNEAFKSHVQALQPAHAGACKQPCKDSTSGQRKCWQAS